ncbi:uncharacterized protein LOC125670390 isoform X2 [Ostrea edulis]|uniref:uncharacterized protein LOC125670390 isoform X2 n=1 Tax=Ostrea edulis TaxID=37623 RepID=UPI0024AF29D7|nr:uncharacterized protein LOC125670390 isoform X2 [Ostrea edulis]
MTSKERQFFQAVDKAQTKMIDTLISQGACVNCRANDGSTPLIKAAKNRNHVVQKLLLQNGADVTEKNALGLTALHYTAAAGDTETLKLLLAYQSPVDVKDAEGCTPLHYAADRNNLVTAEILIFCGANADSKNKKGLSPYSSNKNADFRKIATQSRKVLDGIKNKDVIIQHDELLPGKVTHLRDIDLKIFTTDDFKLTSLSFLCRRVRPEFCMDSLRPDGKEILISDAFECITSTVHVRGMVDLEVPLYDNNDPYEKILIKTNQGVIGDPSAILGGPTTLNEHVGVLRWKLRIRLDITKIKSFILITVPKVEKFDVTVTGKEVPSTVDKFISIKIAPDTFESGTVNLEVIPTPVYKPEKYKDVLSIGHFYDLHHSMGCNHFRDNGVTFTSPLPHEFENEGQLCVLAADIPEDFNPDIPLDENIWEILDKDPRAKKGRVSSALSHFSTHVLAEKRKGSADIDLKHQTVLECTQPQKINDRLNHWKSQDFKVLSPEYTGDFETYEKQEYDIVLSGNIKSLGTTKLQFHSKRENFQQLVISLANKEEPAFGSLDLVEIPEKKGLTSIFLFLSDMKQKEVSKKEDTFKGFTREKLLKDIASRLGHEWFQFSVLLGIPFHKVDTIRTKSTTSTTSVEKKILKILLEWRKHSQHLDDMGVLDLVTALSRVGRNDISEVVHEDLRVWLKENEIEKGDRFYKWAENVIKGTLEVSKNEHYPEPMSDEFFVILVENYANQDFRNLGVLLGIPENQTSNIFADTTFPNFQYRVLRMLIVARERQEDRMKALTNLVDALEDIGNQDAVDWVHTCKNEWSERNKAKKKMSKFQLDLERSIREETGEKGSDIEEEEEGEIVEEEEQKKTAPQTREKASSGDRVSEEDKDQKLRDRSQEFERSELKEKGSDVIKFSNENSNRQSDEDFSDSKLKENEGYMSDNENEEGHTTVNEPNDKSDVIESKKENEELTFAKENEYDHTSVNEPNVKSDVIESKTENEETAFDKEKEYDHTSVNESNDESDVIDSEAENEEHTFGKGKENDHSPVNESNNKSDV